jgi:two-component system KDP operon response regulator KdpE
VLLVEDEEHLAAGIRFNLELDGYEVETIGDGLRAVERLAPEDGEPAPSFDLVLLDVMLPGLDGFQIVERMRAAGNYTPVLMLTARGLSGDVVQGLEAGADDYLPKPFGTKELLARLRVALRHAHNVAGTGKPILEVGPLRMDLERRETTIEGRPVRLTPIEWRLLVFLARHAGKVLTHAQILREVWGPNTSSQSHYVRVYMAELRKKLEPDPSRPRLLLTEPGVGYRLADPPGAGT